jgi:endonuclease/exonuclease/phosphatase family metal-dependent hydrolase
VLSREPPLDQAFFELDSRRVARGVLYTRFRPAGAYDLHVFCTHLSTDLHTPYPGPGSWTAENSRQIEQLLELVGRKATSGTVLLLGDLNTAPDVAQVSRGRWPAHYARLIQHGFVNPYLESSASRCTYCRDNPLVGGGRGDGSVIDHVLLRHFDGTTSSARLLDESVELEALGRRIRSAYSDHYAVMVTLHRDGV